jgi:hypothetical protein
MPAEHYRLIPAEPVDPDDIASSFEALATRIQKRDGCDRVTALQRAVDENPGAFDAYCRTFGVLCPARPEAGSSDGFYPEEKPYSALGLLRTQNIPRCHRPAVLVRWTPAADQRLFVRK